VLCANSDASGRGAVPASRLRVSRSIDLGSVGRVMRDSTAIDRRPPTIATIYRPARLRSITPVQTSG
jgi:hypothetical protein